MTRTEGDGASRLVQLLRGDKRLPTTLTNATVTQVNPLAIRVFGESDDTPAEALVIAESLTERTIDVDLIGGTVGGNVSGGGSLTSLNVTNGKLTIKSPLKVGDVIIIVLADDGQLIYVIDKEAK